MSVPIATPLPAINPALYKLADLRRLSKKFYDIYQLIDHAAEENKSLVPQRNVALDQWCASFREIHRREVDLAKRREKSDRPLWTLLIPFITYGGYREVVRFERRQVTRYFYKDFYGDGYACKETLEEQYRNTEVMFSDPWKDLERAMDTARSECADAQERKLKRDEQSRLQREALLPDLQPRLEVAV